MHLIFFSCIQVKLSLTPSFTVNSGKAPAPCTSSNSPRAPSSSGLPTRRRRTLLQHRGYREVAILFLGREEAHPQSPDDVLARLLHPHEHGVVELLPPAEGVARTVPLSAVG